MTRQAWTLVIAGLLALGACGDDDDDGTMVDAGPADTGRTDTGGDEDTGVDEDAGPDEDTGPDQDAGPEVPALVAAIAGDPDLASLAEAIGAVVEAGILDIGLLEGLDGVTVFAPTNESVDASLAALGIDDVSTATEDELTTVAGVLAYHIVGARLDAATITASAFPGATALLGTTVSLGVSPGVKLYFDTSDGVKLRFIGLDGMEDESSVIEADIEVPGEPTQIIHKIDTLLVPPSVVGIALLEGFTGLAGALGAAANLPGDITLIRALSNPDANYTVFAPTNAAFTAAMPVTSTLTPEQLQGVLLYHVINGDAPVFSAGIPPRADTMADMTMIFGGTNINGGSGGTPATGAAITTTDLQASNGVVHVIDRVLLPPTVASMASIAGLTSLLATIGTVDEDASGSEPEIAAFLTNEQNLTVFAPTNAAFTAAMPVTATLTVDQIRNVLLYHVVQNDPVFESGDFTDMQSIPTLFGGAARQPRANVAGGALTFTDARDQTITPATGLFDIKVSNGIVHVVDTVLVPFGST